MALFLFAENIVHNPLIAAERFVCHASAHLVRNFEIFCNASDSPCPSDSQHLSGFTIRDWKCSGDFLSTQPLFGYQPHFGFESVEVGLIPITSTAFLSGSDKHLLMWYL